MDAWSSSESPDGLLADLEWLNRLAYRLVSDPGLADDACQEAWLAASRQASGARPDRPSLARFLRSTLGSARRSERRRRFHEAQSARRDRLPSTAELLLVGERQQELWRSLSGLSEPYRSVLLLHYQQGISTSELAERSGEAADTIRWRLRRGLELLKESLERDDDGPRLMGLVPLAVLGFGPAKTTTAVTSTGSITGASLGALWMTKKLALTAALALLVLLGWRWLGESTLEPSVPDARADVPAAKVAALAPQAERSPQERSPALAPAVEADSAEPQPGWSLLVTVLQSDGQPAVGAHVLMTVGEVVEPLGMTDVEGRLEGPLPSLDARGLALWDTAYRPSLLVTKFGHASVGVDVPVASLDVPGPLAMTVTLPAGPCLAGRVQGPNGRPLVGAGCTLFRWGEGEFPSQLRSTSSDADGAFALPIEPGVRGFVLIDDDSGRACTPTFDIGVATDLGTLSIDAFETLHGRVTYPDGQPAAGVHVRFGFAQLLPTTGLREDGSFLAGHTWGSTSTDERGRFEFFGVRPGTYVVSATSDPEPGVSEFEVQVPGANEVFLTMPRPRLRVHVHDVNGVPAAGVRVHMKEIPDLARDSEPPRAWYRATNGSGIFSAEVTNGGRYALLVLGRHGTTTEQTLRIPTAGYQHEAHVTIGEANRTCSLRVRLESPEGSYLEDFSVLLRTLPSLLDLEEEERSPGPDGLLTNLPAGRFLMKLYSELDPGNDRYLYLEEDEQVVEVSADETREVTFQMLRGGHVEVSLDVSEWPASTPPSSDRPDPGSAAWKNWLRDYGVTIELRDATGSGLRTVGKLAAFNELNPWSPSLSWAPGAVARNQAVLEPGRYAYRVTSAAWASIDGVVDVRAGEDARLHMTLDLR